jgi:hypothetical protein
MRILLPGKAVVGITAGSSRNNVNNDQLPKYL